MPRHNRPHFVVFALLGECALLIPFVTTVSEAGAAQRAEGSVRRWEWGREGEGLFGRACPPPAVGDGGLHEKKIQKLRGEEGVDRSYQLSGVSWVSMSTLQMGHFLLVASHWSTHVWWKRCMQGNLLQKVGGQRAREGTFFR